jgi:hypothetical protein
MKFKNINKLFRPLLFIKLLKVLSYETSLTTNLRFVKENICVEGEQ